MTLLNSQPLQGYKHGDFVKFKYNTIVYQAHTGLPMFRDVEQYGWLNNPNILNGKVSIQPIGSVSYADHLRVEATKVIDKCTHDKNQDYGKTAPEGFQIDKPVFDVPEGTPTYAGGDIPIRENVNTQRVVEYVPTQKKKGSAPSLDEEIEKQKAMIMGKVNG